MTEKALFSSTVDRIPNWFVDLQVVAVVILCVVAGRVRCDACERYQSVTRVRPFFSFATKLLHRSSCVCTLHVVVGLLWKCIAFDASFSYDSIQQSNGEPKHRWTNGVVWIWRHRGKWKCHLFVSLCVCNVYVYAGDGLATDSKRFVREIQWKFCTSHAHTHRHARTNKYCFAVRTSHVYRNVVKGKFYFRLIRINRMAMYLLYYINTTLYNHCHVCRC